jgi:hypothetical protein
LGEVPALRRRLLLAAFLHRDVEQEAVAVAVDVAAAATNGVIAALAFAASDVTAQRPLRGV